MSASTQEKVLLDAAALRGAVSDIARRIVEAHGNDRPFALLGILTRGRPLADRIAAEIEKLSGTRPKVGSLATTLYRDDLRSGGSASIRHGVETHFDFDVNGLSIVLVDDVLNSGRTVRAAMDEVMDYGRPSRIQLACLIDRGLRELPIQADYLAIDIHTQPGDHVAVRLEEQDGEDLAVLRAAEAKE